MAKKPAKAKKAAKPAKKAAPKKMMSAKPQKAEIQKTRTATRPKNSTLSYTMSEFVENIRGFCGLQKRSEAKEMIEDIATFVRDSLRRGYKIPMMGLGKLYVRMSKARTARNPQTGEEVQVPARKRVRFSASKALKEAVLK